MVKVKVKFPLGVHLKLFVAFRSNDPSLSTVKAFLCGAVYAFVSSVLGTAASNVTAPEETAKSALANEAIPFALVLASDTATVAVPLE